MDKPNYDNVDITAINSVICKINEKIKGYKVIINLENREIVIYRDLNGKFEKKLSHRFARYTDARHRLDGLYCGLSIKTT